MTSALFHTTLDVITSTYECIPAALLFVQFESRRVFLESSDYVLLREPLSASELQKEHKLKVTQSWNTTPSFYRTSNVELSLHPSSNLKPRLISISSSSFSRASTAL